MLPHPIPRRTICGLMVAAMVFAMLVFATPAFASLDDTPTATSATNPHPDDAKATADDWWRQGWGNSLLPNLTFTDVPKDDNGPTLGFIYRFDRSPVTVVDTTAADPWADTFNHWANDPEGASFTHVFDLAGIYGSPPLGGWHQYPGAAIPMEGPWVLHLVFRNTNRYADSQWSWAFGYDATPPTAVTAFDDGIAGWSATDRRRLTWSGATDALSGVGAYEIAVNNAVNGSRTTLVTLPNASSATIEDLGPGLNTISIRAEDRATNLSPPVTLDTYVDTDTPTVAFQTPAASVVGRTTVFAARVADSAGIASVALAIDGTPQSVVTAAPWSFTVDTGSLGAGTHTAALTATDMFGHSATVTKSFTVDMTSPTISNVTALPTPFFPRLRDKYKDDCVVQFSLSEAASVKLEVTTLKGSLVREVTRSLGAGTRSITWDGKTTRGLVAGVGTYNYRLLATDAAGNAVSTRRKPAVVRYFLLVRVAANKVKVVEH